MPRRAPGQRFQLARLLLAEVVDLPQLPRQDEDLEVGVDDLGVEVGVFQRRPEGDGAVVRQDDRVALLDVGHDRFRELLAAGRLVACHRHDAQKHLHLRQNLK